MTAVVRYRPEGSGTTWWGTSDFSPDYSTTWHTLEAADRQFDWIQTNRDGTVLGSAPAQTVQSFFTSYTAAGSHEVGFVLGCSGGSALFDALGVTEEGSDTTWDFEGGTTSVRLDLSRSRAVYGSTIKASSVVRTQATGRQRAVLERRREDGSAARVKRVRLEKGDDTFKLRAAVSGRYRLRLPSTDDDEGSVSSWQRLDVPSRVTAVPATRSIQRDRRLAITGTVSPSARGIVTVWRRANGRWVKAGSTRWSGGRYSLKVKASHVGRQVYRARTSPTARNDIGTSPSFIVTVTAPPKPSGGGGGDTGGGGTDGGGGGGGGGGEDPPDGPQRPAA